ncbi:MAG: transporter related protein [Clostridia bacterium]|jgi:branched-chain amino acid transport system ATP-binding protein|nr:transporter related protein [Clostridia bacterium]
MNVLRVENLSISFGGLKAVDDLSFSVEENSIFGLIGPNGAGKTTVFNCISRFYAADKGKVIFSKKNDKQSIKELDMNRYKVHEVIGQGISRTFQNIELFKNMTVIDNLMIGLHSKTKGGFVQGGFFTRVVQREEKKNKQKAMDMLEFLGLLGIENQYAAAQPYGTQKLIELGRALISSPQLLILDEPAAGMNSTETEALSALIRRIRDELGVTILLVEHDMNLVMGICERICVINFGKKIAEGAPEEIRNNPVVQEAYLGKEEVQSA